MNHLYILGTILFTVYGQLILKWQVVQYGQLPDDFIPKLYFLFKLLLNPFILSGFISGFIASLCWMAAMTKFEVSYAYPFMSAAFVLVLFFSVLFLNETITLQKVIGLILIVAGIIITSSSK